jgi:hypothetical protein
LPAESRGSALSRDRILTVSESAARVRSAFAGLREATRRHLSHGDSSRHLHGVRGSGLSELPAKFRNILILCPDFGGIHVLAV